MDACGAFFLPLLLIPLAVCPLGLGSLLHRLRMDTTHARPRAKAAHALVYLDSRCVKETVPTRGAVFRADEAGQ